jgi:hypothetical protein
MFIVIAPSCSEFKTKDIYELKDEEALKKFLLDYRSDMRRLKIYEAKEFVLQLDFSEKKDA